MVTFHSDGVVLSHARSVHADRTIVIYTLEHGKLRARVKAGLRSSSKLAGSVEPFTYGAFFFAQGRGGLTLIGVDAYTSHRGITSSLQRIATASIASESIQRFTEEHHPEPRIYSLMLSFFSTLNIQTISKHVLRLLPLWLIWNLLTILGSGFEHRMCVRCRKELTPDKLGAHLGKGGVLCGLCVSEVSGSTPLSADTLKLFRLLTGLPADFLTRIRSRETTLKGAESFTTELYQYYLEERSPAFAFYQKLVFDR